MPWIDIRTITIPEHIPDLPSERFSVVVPSIGDAGPLDLAEAHEQRLCLMERLKLSESEILVVPFVPRVK